MSATHLTHVASLTSQALPSATDPRPFRPDLGDDVLNQERRALLKASIEKHQHVVDPIERSNGQAQREHDEMVAKQVRGR